MPTAVRIACTDCLPEKESLTLWSSSATASVSSVSGSKSWGWPFSL